MTEEEWLRCDNTHKMTKFLPQPLSRRKCLLVACSYVRRIAPHIPRREVVDYMLRCEANADHEHVPIITYHEYNEQSDAVEGVYAINSVPYGICKLSYWLLHTAGSERPYFGHAGTSDLRAETTNTCGWRLTGV